MEGQVHEEVERPGTEHEPAEQSTRAEPPGSQDGAEGARTMSGAIEQDGANRAETHHGGADGTRAHQGRADGTRAHQGGADGTRAHQGRVDGIKDPQGKPD